MPPDVAANRRDRAAAPRTNPLDVDKCIERCRCSSRLDWGSRCGPIHGRAAIIEQIRFAVIDAASSHQVHTPEITLAHDDTAQGVWAMQDRVVWQSGKSPIPGVASITGYGQYHESYRKSDDGWKFASLKLTRFHVDMHPD